MLTKDHAICLRTVNYSETSQIVTLFTRESGKIDGIAKGSRRAKSSLGGAIEIFSTGHIVFSPSATGKLATITEFQQTPAFIGLRRNLFTLNCALFSAELLGGLTNDHDPHASLYDLFSGFLSDVQLCSGKGESLSLLILFQLGLLGEMGMMPVLSRCVNCSSSFDANWQRIYFSNDANGVICPDCEMAFTDKMQLSKSTAGCLGDIKTIREADGRTLAEVERVLIYHFSAMMHRMPKMAKHFMRRQG